ncbi:MAG: hypothetical protein M1818_004085 [Claussenomyces sp. TS43310]|nr:MAG: hypothetical protein M1818_004085 [Claussenomyces sp. TS43310]
MDSWRTETIYKPLGHPVTDEVYTFLDGKPDISAPEYLVKPATFSHVESEYVSEHALLIDLGEAFLAPSPPINGVGTPTGYRSPELTLEMKASEASDIWALSLYNAMVRTLGIPPKSFHVVWKQGGVVLTNDESSNDSITDRIREIGMYDQESSMYNGNDPSFNHQTPLLEPLGMGVSEEEVDELADLLRKALDFSPEKRLFAEKVANHDWLLDSH